MAEAIRRGGDWIACRPGCHECCNGPFSISDSEALRMREGLSFLGEERAERIRRRSATYLAQVQSFDEDGLPEGMDEVPCPALDPASGLCELYEWRPITCRTFGPAVKAADGAIGTCELCFAGASDEEIAAAAVEMPAEAFDGDAGSFTFVALALAAAGE